MRTGAATATLIALAMHLSQGALRPAWGEPAAAAAAQSGAPTCDHRAFRVVVDVGHTAGKPGAKSARGADEYDFNLRLAKEIAQKLIDAGFERTVLLITAEAPRVGLFKRAARANAMSADLFLSDPPRTRCRIPSWRNGSTRAQITPSATGSPAIRFSFLSTIPSTAAASRSANCSATQLKARGLKYTPHYTEKFMGHRRRVLVDAEAGVYRYDQLVVLRATRMPAVLLEAGSIINRDEELELGTPERRSLTSDAVH